MGFETYLIPILGHPTIKSLDAFSVGAETSYRHVDILFLDFITEREGEGSLDEFGIFGSA
jgi:hypothetical protein